MNWQYTPYIFPLLIAAIISSALAFYAWQRRTTRGAAALVLLLLAVGEWSLASVFELAGADLPSKIFWSKVQYLGIVTVPVSWLIFALEYTGQGRWLTRRNLALLAILPLVILLLTWTNEVHRWIWADVRLVAVGGGALTWDATYGWAFYVNVGYAYLMLLLGSFLLVRALVRSPRLYRGQAGALLLSVVAPWVGNALSISGLIRFPLDLTLLGFTIAGLIVAWGLFRFRLLDIVPAARDAVVESMGDGLIVLDMQDRIVDVNLAALRMIDFAASDVVGHQIDQVLSPRSDRFGRYCDVAAALPSVLAQQTEAHLQEVRTEIALSTESQSGTLEESSQCYYELRVSPLRSRRGRLAGRLVVLRDITERKQTEEALRAQKQIFEGLVAVARATTERPTLEATLQSALTVASSLTGAEHGTLLLLDEDGAVTHSLVVRGQEPLYQWPDTIPRVMGEGLAGWVAHHRQPVLIADTRDDERWLELPDASFTVRSVLAVPIISGKVLLGILTLTHSQPRYFGTEHADLMQAAADQMALALHNAQIFDVQRRMAERQTTLYQILRAVTGQLDPAQVVCAAVESITQFAGWPNAIIAVPSEDRSHWVVEAVGGARAFTVGQRFPIDQGIIGRALRTTQTQLAPDVRADPDYIVGSSDVQSELAVPLLVGERVLGVLDLESDLPAAFDADDVLLAESLAEAIALAMENASLYAETRQHVSDLNTLYTVTRMAGKSLALEDVLTQALSSILLSFGFQSGLISLVDPVDGHLHLVAEHNLPSVLSRRLRDEGLDGMLCAYVHDRRERLVISSFGDEIPDALRERVASMSTFGLRGYAGIPLLHRESSLGTIGLFTYRPRDFASNEISLLEAIGRQVATAVANARLFQATVNERQRLVTLIGSSRDGIILVGMDEQILVINAPAIELLRLPGRPANWTDMPLDDALDVLGQQAPDAVQATLADMARIKVGDEPPGEWECTVPPRIIHWLNLPVLSGKTPLGRLMVLRDVTEERLLDKMRDDLTHTMVHDLRNPLTSISVALRLLDRKLADVLSPAQRRLLGIADESTQRMVELVSAILDVSRLEGGRMPVNQSPVTLSDLVAETLHLQSPLATAKGLRLESDVSPTLPATWADGELIGRVLQNLIGNAIKFTPAGGLVKVIAWQCDGEVEEQGETAPSHLCVSVIDSGPGISPELQGRLFQKFVVGEHDERGSGLGLAFSKLAVEAHGGRIWVESKVGQGTTFAFTLPMARE